MARTTAPKTALYRVRDAAIWCEAGRADPGDVVELDAAEAKHFDKLGYLAPYIPDDEAEEEDIGSLDEGGDAAPPAEG